MALSHSTENVRYKPIPGFLGYKIGTDGSVWSNWIRGKRPPQTSSTAWQMKTPSDGHGYAMVCLYKQGQRHMRRVCRLVLETFRSPCPKGKECCHKDGNPTNNWLTNLRWGTRKSNMADRLKHGTANRGERHGRSKLTEDAVREIRHLLQNGWTQIKVASKFKVHRVLISMIKLGKVWQWLQ